MRWSMTVNGIWLVALAGVSGYLSLIFVDFVSEGLGREMSAKVYLIALGLPALAFLLAAAAGLGAAWMLARWTSHAAPLARVHPWLLGVSTSVFGALVAATTFYGAINGPSWLHAR